jgi:hypothetical protein
MVSETPQGDSMANYKHAEFVGDPIRPIKQMVSGTPPGDFMANY